MEGFESFMFALLGISLDVRNVAVNFVDWNSTEMTNTERAQTIGNCVAIAKKLVFFENIYA